MAITHYSSISMMDKVNNTPRVEGAYREGIRNNIKDILSGLRDIPVRQSNKFKSLTHAVNDLTRALQSETRDSFVMNEQTNQQVNDHLNGGYWVDNTRNLFTGTGSENPGEATVPFVLKKIKEEMARTHGDAIMDEDFKQIVQRVDKLVAAKRFYDMEGAIGSTAWDLFYLDSLKNKTRDFETKAREFLNKTKKSSIPIKDYKKIDSIAQEAQNRVQAIKTEITNTQARLAEEDKTDPEIVKLVKANEELSAVIKNVGKERDGLESQKRMALENQNIIFATAENLKNQIREIKQANDALNVSMSATDNFPVLIQEAENELLKIKEYEASTIKKYNLTEEKINAVADINRRIENNRKLVNQLQAKGIWTAANYLLEDCTTLSGEALRKRLEENYKGYKELKHPPKNLKIAKDVIDYLAFDRQMAAREIIENITSPNAVYNFIERVKGSEVENERQKLETAGKDLKKVKGARPEDCLKEIETILKNRKAAKMHEANIDNYGRIEKLRDEKIANYLHAIEDKCSHENIKTVTDKLNEAVKQLKALGVDEKSFEEIENILAEENGNENHFESLLKVSNQLMEMNKAVMKDIDAKIPECVNKEKAAVSSLADNTGKIQNIKTQKREVLTTLQNDLNRAILQSTAVNQLKQEQHLLFEEEDALLKDMETADSRLKVIGKEIDSAAREGVLKDIEGIYRSLNDGRIWDSNSTFYEEMVGPVCKILNKPIPTRDQNLANEEIDLSQINDPIKNLSTALAAAKQASIRYLKKKGEPSWYSTKQAHQRNRLAKQIIALSESVDKRMAYASQYKCKKVNPQITDFTEKGKLAAHLRTNNSENPEIQKAERFKKFGELLNRVNAMDDVNKKLNEGVQLKKVNNEPKKNVKAVNAM